MKILEPHSHTGWITCVIDGHWVQAKVYDEPSTYGVSPETGDCGFGRVSKLAILKTDRQDTNRDFFQQCCFNYDRGLDFNEAPPGLLAKVVAELEKLPKICS